MDRREEHEEMVQALRDMCGGSAEAFDRFYARFAPLVMHIALRMLGDRMEAEDMCHDVFLEVLRKGTAYDAARGSLEGWIAVMTRSRCLDRLRRLQRSAAAYPDEAWMSRLQAAAAEPSPEDAVLRRMELAAVREAMSKLPSRQQRAIATAYYEEKTQREMAEAWHVPLGTVKSWIRLGVDNMRRQLAKRGWRNAGEGRLPYDAD